MYFATVDVRDVADLHLLAMTSPAAAGERFVAAAGDVVSLHDVAVLLRARLGADAARVPTGELPDDSVRLSAGGRPGAAGIPPNLGTIRHTSSEKARRVLGWAPRSNEEALLATAESLVRLAGRRE
jgi:dihydroflavonol-4-reductase